MGKQVLGVLIIFLFSLFFGFSTRAASLLNVIINEIAWMGTETSYNDEWIVVTN